MPINYGGQMKTTYSNNVASQNAQILCYKCIKLKRRRVEYFRVKLSIPRFFKHIVSIISGVCFAI